MKVSAFFISAVAVSAAPTFDFWQWGSENLNQVAINIADKIPTFQQPKTDNSVNAETFPWGPITPKPLVDSEALQAYISEPELRVQAAKLYSGALLGSRLYGHPTRVIGSGGHYQTLGHIESTLRGLGPYYNVTKQYFKAPAGVVFGYSLQVNGTLSLDAKPFDLTPPTPKKKPVTAPVVLVKNQGCDLTDYPVTVNGSIALIERGICPFGNKSELAGQAGALAAIVYNNVPGEGVLAGTMGAITPNQVASLSVSYEEGHAWSLPLSLNQTFNATVFVDSFVKNVSTFNIIADTQFGDPDNVVMLGAHSDSVAAGPGINDDGSGTISLLEVATALANFNVTNRVRFAWWAGEEEGLLGSDYYVSMLTPAENAQIRLFMDYDMMASPNYAYQVYNASDFANPTGSEALKNLYIDFYKAQGVNYTLVPFDGRSDYDAFIKNGIPGGGVATGAEGIKTPEEAEMFGGIAGQAYDPCYHSLCDDTTNVNMIPWMMNTKLIAHSVATFAKSLDDFPIRETLAASVTKGKNTNFPYHGPQKFI